MRRDGRPPAISCGAKLDGCTRCIVTSTKGWFNASCHKKWLHFQLLWLYTYTTEHPLSSRLFAFQHSCTGAKSGSKSDLTLCLLALFFCFCLVSCPCSRVLFRVTFELGIYCWRSALFCETFVVLNHLDQLPQLGNCFLVPCIYLKIHVEAHSQEVNWFLLSAFQCSPYS